VQSDCALEAARVAAERELEGVREVAAHAIEVWGLRFRVEGSGFRVQRSGFRVQGSGFGI